jgi:hypothetical protein
LKVFNTTNGVFARLSEYPVGDAMDFAVSGDDIYIANAHNNTIDIYNQGTVIDSFRPEFPYDLQIDIGLDKYSTSIGMQNLEYRQKKHFNGTVVNVTWYPSQLNISSQDMIDGMNAYLDTCTYTTDAYGNSLCSVPMELSYTLPGGFVFSDLKIDYDSNITIPDFTDTLKSYLASQNRTGDIDVPFNFTTNSSVDVTLENLQIDYSETYMSYNPTLSGGLWVYNITDFTQTGDYNLLVIAMDNNGYYSSSNFWIDSYATVGIEGEMVPQNSNVAGNVRFRVDEQNRDIYSFDISDTESLINSTIFEREYDLLFVLDIPFGDASNPNRLNFTAEIEFDDVRFTSTIDNTTNNSVIRNPVRLIPVDLFNISMPDRTRSHPTLLFGRSSTIYGAISIENRLASFEDVLIKFNYTKVIEAIEGINPAVDYNAIEESFYIYKCDYDNISQCAATDWVRLDATVRNTKDNIIYVYSDSTSSYIIAEDNSTKASDTTTPTSSSSSSSGGGGGGGAILGGSGGDRPSFCGDGYCDSDKGEDQKSCPLDCKDSERIYNICGNGICDLGENIENCYSDCYYKTFEYSYNFDRVTLSPGETQTYYLTIINIANESIHPNVKIQGDLVSSYITLETDEVEIDPFDEKTIKITVAIPKDEDLGVYYGDIHIETESMENTIPFIVEVYKSKIAPFKTDIELLYSNLKIDRDFLRIRLNLYENMISEGNVTLSYTIKDFTDTQIIYEDTEVLDVRNMQNYVKDIDFMQVLTESRNESLNFKEGEYLLYINLTSNEYNTFTVTSFNLYEPLWTPERVRMVSIFMIIVILGALGYFGYQRYLLWRKEKMRYIPPDFAKIPKKGDSMLPLGKIAESTKKAFIDTYDMTTHILVAGSTGSGKSVTTSVIVEEVLLKNIPVVIFDPTSQWTGMVKQLRDPDIIKYYKEFGFLPEDARSFKGLIYRVKKPDIDIDFKKYMNPGEVTVFDISGLKPGEYDQAVLKIVNKIFGMSWPESPELKLVLVFDECHRLLEKYGGKGGYIALEKGCREFRKWGIGMIMASQVSTDFKEAVAGNIMTEVQMNTKSMDDIKRIASKYGLDFSTKVSRQGIGIGMIQNSKYNNGKPWFVHFRPPFHDPHKLTDVELDQYSKYAEELDKIEIELAKLKEKGVSVTEIMLEYKLTRDKLKEGSFKMVDIYLKSLQQGLKNIKK